jgi:hypothetical protein
MNAATTFGNPALSYASGKLTGTNNAVTSSTFNGPTGLADNAISGTLTLTYGYVPVTGITGVPTAATAGTPITLSGTVAPSNATNQTIVWSVKSAGQAGATISGNTLNTAAAGTVTVTATITNGLTPTSNYAQDFNITVSTPSGNETDDKDKTATDSVSISGATYKKIADKVYTGKSVKPVPTLTFKNVALKKGTDYTVSYKNNTKIGKATVTVIGKGKYTGTKTITFKIIPQKASVSKVVAGKGQLKVTWKKVSAVQKVTKYEVRYKVKGTAKWQTKTVSAKSASLTIKKLKKGKAYQVQVRSYKTVNKAKYYSEWSKVMASGKIK